MSQRLPRDQASKQKSTCNTNGNNLLLTLTVHGGRRPQDALLSSLCLCVSRLSTAPIARSTPGKHYTPLATQQIVQQLTLTVLGVSIPRMRSLELSDSSTSSGSLYRALTMLTQ